MNLSVVVTTHNRSHLLPGCLQSILNNDFPKEYILVVDDSDLYPHQFINQLTCASYAIPYKFIPNSGLAASRNYAFSQFTTEFVTFLDDDDRWPANYLSSISSYLSSTTSVVLSFSFQSFNSIPFAKYPLGFHLKDLFYCGITPPVGLQIYNKHILGNCLLYNESIVSGVDHDLWINLLSINPSITINSFPVDILSVSSRNSKTSNYHDRYTNIHKALTHWAPIIQETLGQAFYDHFYLSYRHSLDDLLYSSLFKGQFMYTLNFRPFGFFLWCFRRILAKYTHSQMFSPFKE